MANKSYRCCFTDGDDRILKTVQIQARDDAAAVLQIERLLSGSVHPSAELWDGNRLVGRWAATSRDSLDGRGLAAASAV